MMSLRNKEGMGAGRDGGQVEIEEGDGGTKGWGHGR